MTSLRDERVRWYDVLFLLLVAYLILAPAGNNQILLPFLGMAGFFGALRLLMTLGRRDERVLGLPALAGLCAVPMVTLGVLRNNPGAYDVAVPMLLGPIAWFAICHLPGKASLRFVPLVVILGNLVVAVTVLLTLLGIQVPLISYLNPTNRGVLIDGRSRVNLTSATSLIATLPILLALYIHRDALTGWTRRLLPVSVVAGLLALLVSGRQSLVGVVMILPFVLFVLSRLGFKVQRDERAQVRFDRWVRSAVVAIIGVILAATVASGLGVNVSKIPQRALASVGIGQSESHIVQESYSTRSAENSVLLKKIWERPLVGFGAGPVFDELSGRERRTNADRPWRLELHYHLTLAEGGLLIAILYFLLAARARRLLTWVLAQCNPSQQAVFFGLVVGALCLMVASAANPYLRAVGQQWTMFLPVAVAGLIAPATHSTPTARVRSHSGRA